MKILFSGPILARLVQIWTYQFFCEFYLYLMLDIALSYHPTQFKGKLMNETWENGKKRNFGPDFDPFASIFSPQNI